jgi:hypothetical protein
MTESTAEISKELSQPETMGGKVISIIPESTQTGGKRKTRLKSTKKGKKPTRRDRS